MAAGMDLPNIQAVDPGASGSPPMVNCTSVSTSFKAYVEYNDSTRSTRTTFVLENYAECHMIISWQFQNKEMEPRGL